MSGRRWSEHDDGFLRAYGFVGSFLLSGDLGRTESAIRQRAAKLGVPLNPKAPYWEAKEAQNMADIDALGQQHPDAEAREEES
jgi:hypothetical protein